MNVPQQLSHGALRRPIYHNSEGLHESASEGVGVQNARPVGSCSSLLYFKKKGKIVLKRKYIPSNDHLVLISYLAV
jgi:hypothetical protein